MKKRSFSLGEGGIKQLAAKHVEKVVFACLILAGLSLIYFAFKQESVPENMVPANLIGEAKKAREFIHRETWEENAERFPVKLNVLEIVENGLGEEIEGANYVVGGGTITPIERLQLTKRTDPALLTAFDLRARGMLGTIPWKASKPAMLRLNELEYGSLREIETDSRFKDEEEEEEPAAVGFGVLPQAAEAGGDGILTKVPEQLEREMDGTRATGSDANKVGIPGGYIVCVTALVPFRQQIIEFQTLRGTEGSNPEVDYPRYAKLEVERMDLDAATPQFVDITSQVNMWSENSATNYPEVCAPAHYDPKIALRILPFLRQDPTQLALHPLIPAKKWVEAEAEVEEGEVEEGAAFDLTSRSDEGGPPDEGDTQGNMQQMMAQNMAAMGMGGGPGADAAENMADLVLEPEKAPEFKLVRFFDVITVPGKRYQYRVRLRLYDPNLPGTMVRRSGAVGDELADGDAQGPSGTRGMEEMMKMAGKAQGGAGAAGGPGGEATRRPAIEVVHGNKRIKESMLDDAVRQRLRDLEASPDFASKDEDVRFGIATAWSEPSNVVTSPAKAEDYYAGTTTLDKEREAKGVKFFQGEPKAELAISVWDPFYMYYLPGLDEVRRGSSLNFKKVVKLIHPIDLTIREIRGRKIKPSGRNKEITYDGHELESQSVVIDIMGGLKLPNKTRSDTDFFSPGEVLVFDGESFSLQDELEDKRLFRENSLYEVKEEETPSMMPDGTPGGGPAGLDIFGGN